MVVVVVVVRVRVRVARHGMAWRGPSRQVESTGGRGVAISNPGMTRRTNESANVVFAQQSTFGVRVHRMGLTEWCDSKPHGVSAQGYVQGQGDCEVSPLSRVHVKADTYIGPPVLLLLLWLSFYSQTNEVGFTLAGSCCRSRPATHHLTLI